MVVIGRVIFRGFFQVDLSGVSFLIQLQEVIYFRLGGKEVYCVGYLRLYFLSYGIFWWSIF